MNTGLPPGQFNLPPGVSMHDVDPPRPKCRTCGRELDELDDREQCMECAERSEGDLDQPEQEID